MFSPCRRLCRCRLASIVVGSARRVHGANGIGGCVDVEQRSAQVTAAGLLRGVLGDAERQACEVPQHVPAAVAPANSARLAAGSTQNRNPPGDRSATHRSKRR
jgi:hypothetical protein